MSEANYSRIGDLEIHPAFKSVVENEICKGTEISTSKFWKTLETLLKTFSDKNEALLRKRDSIQAQIDAFHLERVGRKWDAAEYTAFLTNIGYIVPEGPDFQIETDHVDPEIASIAGPQLVVPVDKARFALNAANSRWGSLLDAFYGTDAGPPETPGFEKGKSYNPKRGAKVFEYAHAFLDEFFPLTNEAKYENIQKFELSKTSNGSEFLNCLLAGGKTVTLQNSEKFIGYQKNSSNNLCSVLFKNNDLHVEIQIDSNGKIGQSHKAGVNDIILESAITAICDMEDSVAAVDALDKCNIYKNWSRLMRNSLEEKFKKNNNLIHRKLNEDKIFQKVAKKTSTGINSGTMKLPGRVVLLVRNVGLHMYTDCVRFAKNQKETPEGLIDLLVTVVSALHDIGKNSNRKTCFNSRTGSIYIVKPKQHGPEEVEFTVKCFETVEKLLGLRKNCIKIGIMDEERRTTANLKECIRKAKYRCIFINTGFMDRTGDEFHTTMQRGAYLTKEYVKKAVWLDSYENWNVDVGIQCGLVGKAQIGKGMWAAPDSMKSMLEKKINHPLAGATCAWVPSPTAAILHAIHYHRVNVGQVLTQITAKGKRSNLSDIMTPPLIELYNVSDDFELTEEIVQKELENNVQAILGYVVRWVIMGVGCSKVPDINNEPLMEDRATLRINSQHIANWLLHGVVSESEVLECFKRMSKIVDEQNKGQEGDGYENMFNNFETNNGYLCAVEMVKNGLQVPNGLTEFSLTKFRRAQKKLKARTKL